jgi:hypothetical protein
VLAAFTAHGSPESSSSSCSIHLPNYLIVG